jgi:hypothetical protein
MRRLVLCKESSTDHTFALCSCGLSATRQYHFSLRTNQQPINITSLRTNQHQLPVKRTGSSCIYYTGILELYKLTFIRRKNFRARFRYSTVHRGLENHSFFEQWARSVTISLIKNRVTGQNLARTKLKNLHSHN